jgi:peptidoglycan-N-acetylglucosamine deacetylase
MSQTQATSPVAPPFAWPDGKSGAVSLSFDDARVSQIDVGMEIFDRHDAKGTFYVSLNTAEKRLAGWKRAVENGHEIGNHSIRHPCSGNFKWARGSALEDYTLQQMDLELAAAQDAITDLLGVTPKTFAYPCGQTFVGRGERLRSYIPVVAKRFLVGRTFRDEFQNDPAYCDLARLGSFPSDGLTYEEARLLIEAAVRSGTWLVFTGHDIGEKAYQGVPSDALDGICRYCLDPANGVWLDTVAAVGSYVAAARARQ